MQLGEKFVKLEHTITLKVYFQHYNKSSTFPLNVYVDLSIILF